MIRASRSNMALVAAAVVALAVGLVLLWGPRSDRPRAAAPAGPSSSTLATTTGPAPSGSSSPAAIGQNGPTSRPSNGPVDEPPATSAGDSTRVPAAAARVAGLVVQAYTQYSFRDPGPEAALQRLASYASPELVDQVRPQFLASAGEWDQQVVDPQRETSTTVRSVEPSVLHQATATQMTVTVTYTNAVRDLESTGWSKPTSELSKFVTLRRTTGQPGWVAVRIIDTADRSAGQSS